MDRIRPILKRLSSNSSQPGRRSSRSRSRSRVESRSSETTTTNASAPTQDSPAASASEIPPVPPIPAITISHVPKSAMKRKVWIKRAGATSATRAEIDQDGLCDDLRDAIIYKYRNSLSTYDSPDIILKILSRDPATNALGHERTLGPEESIGTLLDEHFPGGQKIEEALIIDVPKPRTPKPSPRPGNHQIQYYVPEQFRPDDGARDYFPPMPLQSPQVAQLQAQAQNGPAMAVLTTGQLPPLPSPGGRQRRNRPQYGRQHTSSPTILHSTQPNSAGLGT